jgi:hypothetical protein
MEELKLEIERVRREIELLQKALSFKDREIATLKD